VVKKIGLFLCLILSVCLTYADTPKAYLLEVQGAIGPAVEDYINRGISKANEDKANAIILQMDTPGGLAKSMRDIIKEIITSKVPVIAYVAPSGARAASAGTYILYAAHVATMAPGTNLGAATPIAMEMPGTGHEKDKKSPSDLKAINDARAYIRALAQMRHRNVEWAEKAVSQAESLSAEEALKLKVINLIAKNIPELLQKVNGMTVEIQGAPAILNTNNLSVVSYKVDWRTRFLAVITDPTVAYILLMIGFYGIFFELLNPGFIAPGVIGVIALLVGLYGLALLPINYVGLGLIILGLAFLVAEAFLPSGALGVGGVVSFIIGSILLFKAPYIGFTLPITTIVVVTIFTIIFVLIILSLAIRSRRKPIVSGREALINKEGILDIDPDGKKWVRIEGERWQCRSDVAVKNGDRVQVVRVEGLILVVKPVTQ